MKKIIISQIICVFIFSCVFDSKQFKYLDIKPLNNSITKKHKNYHLFSKYYWYLGAFCIYGFNSCHGANNEQENYSNQNLKSIIENGGNLYTLSELNNKSIVSIWNDDLEHLQSKKIYNAKFSFDPYNIDTISNNKFVQFGYLDVNNEKKITVLEHTKDINIIYSHIIQGEGNFDIKSLVKDINNTFFIGGNILLNKQDIVPFTFQYIPGSQNLQPQIKTPKIYNLQNSCFLQDFLISEKNYNFLIFDCNQEKLLAKFDKDSNLLFCKTALGNQILYVSNFDIVTISSFLSNDDQKEFKVNIFDQHKGTYKNSFSYEQNNFILKVHKSNSDQNLLYPNLLVGKYINTNTNTINGLLINLTKYFDIQASIFDQKNNSEIIDTLEYLNSVYHLSNLDNIPNLIKQNSTVNCYSNLFIKRYNITKQYYNKDYIIDTNAYGLELEPNEFLTTISNNKLSNQCFYKSNNPININKEDHPSYFFYILLGCFGLFFIVFLGVIMLMKKKMKSIESNLINSTNIANEKKEPKIEKLKTEQNKKINKVNPNNINNDEIVYTDDYKSHENDYQNSGCSYFDDDRKNDEETESNNENNNIDGHRSNIKISHEVYDTVSMMFDYEGSISFDPERLEKMMAKSNTFTMKQKQELDNNEYLRKKLGIQYDSKDNNKMINYYGDNMHSQKITVEQDTHLTLPRNNTNVNDNL